MCFALCQTLRFTRYTSTLHSHNHVNRCTTQWTSVRHSGHSVSTLSTETRVPARHQHDALTLDTVINFNPKYSDINYMSRFFLLMCNPQSCPAFPDPVIFVCHFPVSHFPDPYSFICPSFSGRAFSAPPSGNHWSNSGLISPLVCVRLLVCNACFEINLPVKEDSPTVSFITGDRCWHLSHPSWLVETLPVDPETLMHSDNRRVKVTASYSRHGDVISLPVISDAVTSRLTSLLNLNVF